MNPEPETLTLELLDGVQGCDAFQIAIEMRKAGCLEAQAAALLDAHLPGCEACQRYRRDADDVDAVLAREPRTLDWSRIERKIAAVIQSAHRRFWWGLLGTPATLLLVALVSTITGHRVPLGLYGVVAAIMLAMSAAQYRSARGLDRVRMERDVIGAYRSEMTRRIELWRRSRWGLLPGLGVGILQLFQERLPGARGDFHLVMSVIMVIGFAACLLLFPVTAARARRELAELR